MTKSQAGNIRLGLAALVAALFSSCIVREAPTASPQAPAPTTTSALPPPAERAATGRYGQVAGQDVLAGKGIRAFGISGAAERIEARWMPVTDQPFSELIRVKTIASSKNAWDVQVHAANATPIEAGDTLLATVYFRTEWVADESGEGQTEAVFEMAVEPWTKSVTYPLRASSKWKKVFVPFTAVGNFAPGEAKFAFRMGYENQTIELAGLTLTNFGKELALADLPTTQRTYGGSAADAPWRAAAAARIEAHRKAELRIVVQNKAGAPLPGAQVSVHLKRHAFNFGTAAPADLIVGDKNRKFRDLIPKLFNLVTIENNLKWQPLAGDWGPSFTIERAQAAVNWLNSNKLLVRGHVLVWPGWQNLPAKLQRHKADRARLRKEVAAHIKKMTQAVRGQVVDWDVVNEPFTNHDLLDILGPEVMVDWFKLARKHDPKAKLYINDFAILNGGGGNTSHRDHYEQMIQILVDNNAPFDGIGFQGHFGTALTAPADIYQLLERYGKFNKTMAVTEYDLLLKDEELAARYLRDFYTIMFSHPLVETIVMWGFWDKRHWKKNAPLYRADWSEKPALKVYRRLLEEEWSTRARGQTDANGLYSLRGFLGDYEIVVSSGGTTHTLQTTLKKASNGTAAEPTIIRL